MTRVRMRIRSVEALVWSVTLSLGCGGASPSADEAPPDAGPDIAQVEPGEDIQDAEPSVSDAGVSDVGEVEARDVVPDTDDTYWAGGTHPPPPDDLPPVPEPPATLGPGFVDLSVPWDEASPFVLSLGTPDRLPSRTAALFGDLDGDGVSEVVVTGTGEAYEAVDPEWFPVTSRAYRHDPEADQLVLAEDLPMPHGFVLAVVDLDGDGRDDIMVQGPSTIHWGGEPLTENWLLDRAGGEHTLEWRGIALADLDDDGLVDLIAQPAYCCTLECPELVVVLATGRRRHTVHPELTATVNHANVCASLVAPVGPERLMMSFAAIGNCGGMSHVFYREVERDPDGWPRLEAVAAAGVTGTLNLALDAPMGGSVADVDGDGDFDLTVTTDAHHAMYRAEADWPMTDVTTWTGIGDSGVILPPEPLGPHRYMIPWGAAFLDLDQDGRVDVLYSHGADPNPGSGKPVADVGPQHLTAHWNGGDWRFADVTDRLALGRLGEWRGLTVGDLDGDGDADLGVGGLGQFPRVYRNDIVSEGHGLSLRLRGTTSNPLGLGAVVRVRPRATDPEQMHVVGHIGNPYGASQPLVFVGLGSAETAETVEITWPSGFVQVLSGLEAGGLHVIEEPPTITVSPWSRRLHHSGSESAVIEAYARAPDGSIEEGAVVTLHVVYGLGVPVGSATPHEGGWRWELGPPGIAGTTVVEVRIDGTPVLVRPRIFWD